MINNTFSLEQISKTGNLDANLILRQYKLDIMCQIYGNKIELTRSLHKNKYVKNLGISVIQLVKRNRNDINMQSPYRYNTSKKPPKYLRD